eukprot:763363-Hanusia_phi.AAC.3
MKSIDEDSTLSLSALRSPIMQEQLLWHLAKTSNQQPFYRHLTAEAPDPTGLLPLREDCHRSGKDCW